MENSAICALNDHPK